MRVLLCFFFKHKTAYELRISDWSSDVCSSDLTGGGTTHEHSLSRALGPYRSVGRKASPAPTIPLRARSYRPAWYTARVGELTLEIGRAACRERGCSDV